MLNVVAIQDSSHVWEELQLVQRRLTSLTRLVVGLTSAFHLDLEKGELLVDFILEILSAERISKRVPRKVIHVTYNLILLSALRAAGLFNGCIQRTINRSFPSLLGA